MKRKRQAKKRNSHSWVTTQVSRSRRKLGEGRAVVVSEKS